jgi:integrase
LLEEQQMPANAHLKLVTPTSQNATVMPKRPPNTELRTREHLTPVEIDKLIAATKHSRYPQRDATLILVAYRHGLRAQEAADLEWSQVEFETATMHIRRVKRGKPAEHPIRGDELRALRQLQREQEPQSSFVFTTERGTPFTPAALNRLVSRLGVTAGFDIPLHFHMLRHSCGFALANAGHTTRGIQDWLGHQDITHTARYTELIATKFKDFWR